MAEPQPSTVQEGAAEPHAPTGTADDRKAAAALSTLDAQEDNAVKKEVDGKALDKAMKNLSVKSTAGEEMKNVKVEPADVNLLVCKNWRKTEKQGARRIGRWLTTRAGLATRSQQAKSYRDAESV